MASGTYQLPNEEPPAVLPVSKGGTGTTSAKSFINNTGTYSFTIDSGATTTVTYKGNVALIIAKRTNATAYMALVDWMYATPYVINSKGNDIPTVTVDNTNKKISIKNNRSNTLGVMVISLG